MDDRDRLRLRLTRDLMRLVRVRDFRTALPALREDGTSPIVVGLQDDTISTVMEQISRVGGHAHVVVPPTDLEMWPHRMSLLQIQKGSVVLPAQPDDHANVQPESELGMLLGLLRMRGRMLTFHICQRETTVELVDDGSTDLVPA